MFVIMMSTIVINADPSIHVTAVPIAYTKSDSTPLNAGIAVPNPVCNPILKARPISIFKKSTTPWVVYP